MDDNLRSFPEGPQALADRSQRKAHTQAVAEALARLDAGDSQGRDFSALRIPTAPQPAPVGDPLAGLTDEQAQALAEFNASEAAGAAINTARNNRLSVLPWADKVAKAMGLLIDWKTPEGATCLGEVLKAYRQATAEVVRSLVGTPSKHVNKIAIDT